MSAFEEMEAFARMRDCRRASLRGEERSVVAVEEEAFDMR